MKTKLNLMLIGLLLGLIITPTVSNGQNEKAVINTYLSGLSKVQHIDTLQKYRMTAIYTNRDLYGNFTGKIKITGDYTRGLDDGFVNWEQIYIANSNTFAAPFPIGTKQTYMENMTYVPSPKMLEAQAFTDFPASNEAVYAKNLIWDMMAIEGFAWDHTDSLELNKIYRIPEMSDEFEMADVGTYAHAEIQLCWTGISTIDDELFALIEFRALDNLLAISMPSIKTKGTEQYWGTVWVSLKNKRIGKAVMYGGTAQEIEITGMENKLIMKTIRELWVDKIP